MNLTNKNQMKLIIVSIIDWTIIKSGGIQGAAPDAARPRNRRPRLR